MREFDQSWQNTIASRPYAERQMILVMPDEALTAAHEAARKQAEGKKSSEQDVVSEVLKTVSRMLFPTMDFIAEVTKDLIAAWLRARESGVNVLPVARSDAAKLTMPIGHPRDNVLYVGHPVIPSVYYTCASFHRLTFEHKFAEAVNLLMSLGATEIRVEHVRGWSREFSSRMSATIPEAEIGANFDKKGGKTESLLYEAKLSPQAAPKLPANLSWYHHEPTWQSIAQGRLEHGLREFSLTVIYEDDFGVNAGLKGEIKKTGLDLGGTFEGHEDTTWKISGKFAVE